MRATVPVLGTSPASGQELDFRALVETAPIGMAVLDRDLRYVLCNALLADINGKSQLEHVGRTVAEVVPDVAPAVEEAFRNVLAGRQPSVEFTVRGTTAREPDRQRSWQENARPMRGADDAICGIIVTVQDITDVEEARTALQESERMLRASLQLSQDGFTILRAVRGKGGEVTDFSWEFANSAALDKLKLSDVQGKRLLALLPGNRDHPELFLRYVRLLEAHGADEVELSYEADGLTGWYRNSAVAIDEERIAVGFRDITARKHTEEQLRLVTEELKHRNRNLLAVVSGMLSLAGRSASDVPSLISGVRKQLVSLAASQDLLTATIAGDVPLGSAIDAALEPFAKLRIEVERGPPVSIPAKSVVDFIMALSEMATNSLKHGALSTAGRVRIGWSQHGDNVCLTWTEEGGPPVAKPVRSGLGTKLLKEAGKKLPDGRVESLFNPDGVTIRFTFHAGRLAS